MVNITFPFPSPFPIHNLDKLRLTYLLIYLLHRPLIGLDPHPLHPLAAHLLLAQSAETNIRMAPLHHHHLLPARTLHPRESAHAARERDPAAPRPRVAGHIFRIPKRHARPACTHRALPPLLRPRSPQLTRVLLVPRSSAQVDVTGDGGHVR